MKKPKKMDGKSLNPQEELLELLKSKLPEIFAEGKIDCQRLKQTLGEEVNLDSERYGMTWAGKSNCFRVIQEPTTATLKPARDESVDFDETKNLFIEGDNLEVLKILQKSYYGKVKMAYLDPPYNTGNDFIYNDDFKQNKTEYEQEAGIKDNNGNLRVDGLHKNTKDMGHYHSNWMNMMYPRLFLARNLLSQDGAIFLSIDDNEVKNLRGIMDEIFGEENFVAQITLLCNPKGRAQDKHFATNHEFVLVYSKQPLPKGAFTISKEKEQIESEYTEEDAIGKYRTLELRNTHREFGKHNRKNLYYPLFVDPQTGSVGLDETKNSIKVLPDWEDGFEGCWTWGKPKAEEDIDFLVGKTVNGDKKWKIFVKDYANGATKMLKTIFSNKAYYTEKGQKVFNELFDTKHKVFQSPKSVDLIMQLIRTSTSEDDTVIDFFAGSGTTAHAVMALNAEDGGNRKCISVQLPELCDESSEAYKVGYKTIADIAKERIRRAGKKIREEKGSQLDLDGNKLDTGFKVFKLDQSNFKIWRTDVKDEKSLLEQMSIFIDNVKTDSTQDNILYELILKSGLDLNVDVQKKEADKKTYFAVEDGKLVICLEDKISQSLVDAILADKPEKVICLDKAFGGNDQLKTNTLLQMESAKIDFKVI